MTALVDDNADSLLSESGKGNSVLAMNSADAFIEKAFASIKNEDIQGFLDAAEHQRKLDVQFNIINAFMQRLSAKVNERVPAVHFTNGKNITFLIDLSGKAGSKTSNIVMNANVDASDELGEVIISFYWKVGQETRCSEVSCLDFEHFVNVITKEAAKFTVFILTIHQFESEVLTA